MSCIGANTWIMESECMGLFVFGTIRGFLYCQKDIDFWLDQLEIK
jgi:hypothetical protein